MDRLRQFYIDGAWVDPVDGTAFEVIDPAHETVIETISLGGRADVDRAVAAARAAFPSWSLSTPAERMAVLERLRTAYEARREEFAVAMRREMGTPMRFSRAQQAPTGSQHIDATLEAMADFPFAAPSPRGGSQILAEPVGVAALITPWNWPINQVIAKVAPALATGCTCVLKPSEFAPLSAHLFAEVIDAAGVPAGVFNLVQGDGAGAGGALAAHPQVDLVSFTGSARAGTAISIAAAPTIKRVALELGGKSPNLIFADADVAAAVRWSVAACFANSGQTGDAPTRLLAERPIYDQVVARAAAEAEATRVGDPATDGDHLGPVVNRRQFARIQDYIQTGLEEGARLVAGGPGRPAGMDRGYYVRPTVFADVTPDMTLAREEIFGPVLAIMSVTDEAAAVALANDTPYGLAAYLHTGDGLRAARVTRQLRAGLISVNGGYPDVDVPFGGAKQSGNGRENGAFGFHEFIDWKSVTSGDGAYVV
ncbi:MAG: aldehyde dehydrogenase family protein [Pseudomonadota bacterium]|nr:aldehyde dehydrogenase family protein [Pseudomonadota bacterium]